MVSEKKDFASLLKSQIKELRKLIAKPSSSMSLFNNQPQKSQPVYVTTAAPPKPDLWEQMREMSLTAARAVGGSRGSALKYAY